MRSIRKEMEEFAKAALNLCMAIENNNAETMICKSYPFEKSFDEIMNKIIDWKNDVQEVEKIVMLKPGDIVDIALYDLCSGNARVIKNDTSSETLSFVWVEDPTPCYPSQIIETLNVWKIKYENIAYVSKHWTPEDILSELEDSNYSYASNDEEQIVRLISENLSKGAEIEDAIDSAMVDMGYKNEYGDPIYQRLEKSLKAYP